METSVLEKTKQEKIDVQVNVKSKNFIYDLINAVPAVSLNQIKKFNLVYNSKTGEILKDIKMLPANSKSHDYSMLEFNVNSEHQISFASDKVKSLTEYGNVFQTYIKEKFEELEPYQRNEFDLTETLFYEDRKFGSAAGDKVIKELITHYNNL